ncbi:ABC transporter ATP-binding protein [Nonomuraea sp. NPDC059007]|uniref:ABC transporter ATP-binding protein n=1 Tax=Nonomuraea sp. NPDC059007 TaxID=3346692 RepID=UPI0036AB9EC8
MEGADPPDPRPIRTGRRSLELLRLLVRAGGRPGALAPVVGLMGAAVPALEAVVSGHLVAALLGRGGQSAGGLATALIPLVLFAALIVAQKLTDAALAILDQLLTHRIDGWIRERVRLLALAQRDLSTIEDHAFQDEVARACGIGPRYRVRSAGTAVVSQLRAAYSVVAGLSAGVVLAGYLPWSAALLVALALLIRWHVARQWFTLTEAHGALAGRERGTEYTAELASGAEAGKEVRLFGLGGWLTERWRTSFLGTHEEIWTARHRFVLGQLGTGGLLYVAAGLLILLVPPLTGGLPADALVACLVAGVGVLRISGSAGTVVGFAYGSRAAVAFADLTRRYGRPSPPRDGHVTGGGAPEIRFDNVSFAYPGSATKVLDGLTLEVRPGEVLAIVGRNGAGKTTLTKLLAGLYRPDAGRILIDGRDLADLDVVSWRRTMTAVFQDFVQYPETVERNVRLAAPGGAVPVAETLEKAGAAGMVAALPQAEKTLLWRGGSGAADLSGGQWQKLAIARALHAVACGRRVVVLDEPTAHLDVRAEAEFFDQVVRAVPGVSVILISHRLSTVRRADRIVLQDGGRITEIGTHDELLASGGEYARLFRLQAARFSV